MEVLKHGESAGVVATCGQEHACRCATEVIAMNAQTPARLNARHRELEPSCLRRAGPMAVGSDGP
jgi:hypothetical protein